MKLHIDIETYSSIDIKLAGSYKYFESIDFEILIIAYANGNELINVVDLAKGEQIPYSLKQDLLNPKIIKCAHNANFERNAFKIYGIDIPINQWECSMAKAAYNGWPLALSQISKAMKLE